MHIIAHSRMHLIHDQFGNPTGIVVAKYTIDCRPYGHTFPFIVLHKFVLFLAPFRVKNILIVNIYDMLRQHRHSCSEILINEQIRTPNQTDIVTKLEFRGNFVNPMVRKMFLKSETNVPFSRRSFAEWVDKG